jgi:hypothetical protein
MSDDAFIGLGPGGLRIGVDVNVPRPDYCAPVFTEVYDPRFFPHRQYRYWPHREVTYLEVAPPPYPTAYTYNICPTQRPNVYYDSSAQTPANSETYYYNQRLYPPTQSTAQQYDTPDYEDAPAQTSTDSSTQNMSAYARTAANYYARQRDAAPQNADSEIDLPLPDNTAPQTSAHPKPDGTIPQAAARPQPDSAPAANTVQTGDEIDMPLPDNAPVQKAATTDKPTGAPVDNGTDTPPDAPVTDATPTAKANPPGDTPPAGKGNGPDATPAVKGSDAPPAGKTAKGSDTPSTTPATATDKAAATEKPVEQPKPELQPLPDVNAEAAKIRDKIDHALSQGDNGNFDNETEILHDLLEIKKHGDLGTIYLDELRRKLYEDGPWHINAISPGTATITLNADGSIDASKGGLFGAHERAIKIDPTSGKIDRNGYHWFGRNSDDAKSTTVPAAS